MMSHVLVANGPQVHHQVHSGDWVAQSLSVYLVGCADLAWLVGLFLFHLSCLRTFVYHCNCGLEWVHTIDFCLHSCSSRPVHTIAPSTIDGVARKLGLKAKDVKVVIVNHLDFMAESEQKNKEKCRP